jgi:hypothetical protein
MTSRRLLAASAVAGVALVAVLFATLGCGPKPPPEQPALPDAPDPALSGPDFFEDVTKTSGIDFAYRNGEEEPRDKPHLAILESLGGGLATLDYDGDGKMDLYIPGGGHYGGLQMKDILGHPGRLYRNEGNWKFTDATAAAGLDTMPGVSGWFYSHAATAGDFDRDGWTDLLVSGWGRIALFHNEPDGKGGRKFVDVSAKAGLDRGITWATSAAWADFDGDGFADLFVCQYVDWSFANHPDCNYDGKTPDVCPPKKFKGLPSKVYRNKGDGTFEDVSDTTGVVPGGEQASKSLGVVVADVNADGKPDVYVANDTVANFLYVNKSTKGKIAFAEDGKLAGVAFDGGGGTNGSMGVDAGDPEGTGKPAIWVTNYENEFHALYRNHCTAERVSFVFATQASGVGSIGQKFVGWGTGFIDFDHDGWEDIFIANGHAIRYPTGAPRQQRPVLFLNRGQGKFKDISARGGPYFKGEHLSRGMVTADFDNDGRQDLAVLHTNQPVSLLKNVLPTGDRTWVGVDLAGDGNADVVGAKVTLESGGRTQTRFAKGGGSYASTPDRRLVFGLGDKGKVTKLTVTWPDGKKQEWADVPTGKYHVLVQGKAELQSERPRK